MLLPPEVQSYIRHLLHVVGMAIVAYSGGSVESVDLWVGIGVNAISLLWFVGSTYKAHQEQKAASKQCDCSTEYCECNEKEG